MGRGRDDHAPDHRAQILFSGYVRYRDVGSTNIGVDLQIKRTKEAIASQLWW